MEYSLLGRAICAETGHVLSRSSASVSAVVLLCLGSAPQATLAQEQSESRSSPLQEVLVTAQKRTEELADVPIPISVVNGDALVDSGQMLLRDYYTSVPSLNIINFAGGVSNLSIRGISASGGNPTVGITVDDVPFGGATSATGSGDLPDLDPGDIDHIEVLRGPQGTLYGANSMGGLVKYVTKDPSSDRFSGRAEAGTSSVFNGAELGYNVRASVNAPLTDRLSMRVSGFGRQDPGYIDNPSIGRDGINKAVAFGGHWSAMWRPSDDTSLKLSALYQHYESDGLPDVVVQPGVGDLQQIYIPGIEGLKRTDQAYTAVLKSKFESFEFTSVSGYNSDVTSVGADFSSLFGQAVEAAFGVGGAPFTSNDLTARKFFQELRFSTQLGARLEWLFGAIYTHDKYEELNDDLAAADAATGQIVGQYFDSGFTSAFQEYAAFTDLTYHFTERFDIQVGARESDSKLKLGVQFATGPIVGSPQFTPPEESKANVFTYLLTPRFKVSSDVMVYVRLASGYRPGLPNMPIAGAPPFSIPDKTRNYELGVKGDFLDHTFSVDASLYYIDWKNIQIALVTPDGFSYTANGSAAKSEGVELSLQSRPLTGLTIAGWFVYDDAVLTQVLPENSTVYGARGDRLPNTNRFSANLTIDQSFPLGSRVNGFVGGGVSYVGDSVGGFTGVPGAPSPRQIYPAYTKTDLRAGVKYESWTVNAYVNNVADVRAQVGGGIGFSSPTSFIFITPRTIGLNISRLF